MKIKKYLEKWPYVLLFISFVVFVYAGVNIYLYNSSHKETVELSEKLQNIHQVAQVPSTDSNSGKTTESVPKQEVTPAKTPQEIYDELVSLNSDYLGWMELAKLDISYPVVQRDNDYYLKHNFEQKADRHGTIFRDSRCSNESAVWLLHGHHMKDKTMFANLKEMENKYLLNQHPQLTFDFGEGNVTYRVYAAALVDFSQETAENPSFHYEQIPASEAEFETWQKRLRSYSYWYDEETAKMLDATEPANVIALSTCEYGTELQRLIVVFVKESE